MPTPHPLKVALASLAAALLALSPALLTGCGKASGRNAVVSGKVSYKGQPVTGGLIKFVPADNGSPALGPINGDGTFSFGGVPFGPMQIGIDTESVRNAARADYTRTGKAPPGTRLPESAGPRPAYVPLPKKYADPKTSGLTWDVQRGSLTKDFDLQ
jgi:hypothetical protein